MELSFYTFNEFKEILYVAEVPTLTTFAPVARICSDFEGNYCYESIVSFLFSHVIIHEALCEPIPEVQSVQLCFIFQQPKLHL